MPGPAGLDDPAMEQAELAQLAPRAYLDAWRRRYAPAASAGAPPSPIPKAALAIAAVAAQAEHDSTMAGPAPRVKITPSDGAAPAAEPGHAARPKPVPPHRSGGQREAALDAARQRNAALKALRASLRSGELTLEELLEQAAQGDQAAARMRVTTSLMALPGIGAATAARLLREAGIDRGHRAGGLTAGQRERLLAAAGAMDAKLTARRDRHT